jgi:hypothetical protein
MYISCKLCVLACQESCCNSEHSFGFGSTRATITVPYEVKMPLFSPQESITTTPITLTLITHANSKINLLDG